MSWGRVIVSLRHTVLLDASVEEAVVILEHARRWHASAGAHRVREHALSLLSIERGLGIVPEPEPPAVPAKKEKRGLMRQMTRGRKSWS